MNTQDELLFKFFYDLDGIIKYKDDYENCNKIYTQAQIILKNNTYSDINIQDEEGNTFLHYAFYYSNNNYIHTLLDLGANPYIKNTSNRNCFQNVYKNYNFISQFWESISKLSVSHYDFLIKKNQGKNYHPEFRQSLLEVSISKLFDIPDDVQTIVQDLKKADLYSHNNLINILFNSKVYGADLTVYLDYIKSINLTKYENSYLLFSLSKFYNNNEANMNAKNSNAIIDYFNNNDFEIDSYTYKALMNYRFLESINEKNKNTEQFFIQIISKLLSKNLNFYEIIKLESDNVSFIKVIENHPYANTIFKTLLLEHELNKKLINNSSNKIIKKV